MFAYATTKNDHARFLRYPRQLVESANIVYDVHYQAWVFERVEIDHIPERSVRERRTEHRNVVLHSNPQRSNWQIARCIHFVCPVVHRLLVINLFSQSPDKGAGRPNFAGLLLFGKHLVQYGHEPIFEFAVVVVGDDEVADAIHASATEICAIEIKVGEVGLSQAFDKVLFNAASRSDEGSDMLVLDKVQDYFT